MRRWSVEEGAEVAEEERIKASWVSIRWLEASREDSPGLQEGDRLHGRLCIPLASQKPLWSRWRAHTARLWERAGRRGAVQEAYGSNFHLRVFIRLGFICLLVALPPLFEQRPSICLPLRADLQNM